MPSMLAYHKFGKKNFDYVFLHGFCEDSRMWTEFIQEAGIKAITIDLPGYGGSEDVGISSMEKMAEDVHFTLTELGVTNFVLAGHSMGGYVAMEYLAKYSEDLKGVALIHSHPFKDDKNRISQRKKTLRFIENYGIEAFAKQFFPKLFASENQDNFAIHSLSLRATQIKQETITNSIEAMMSRKDHMDTYKNASIPVLLVLGKEDSLINFRSTVEISVEPKYSMIEIYDHVAHQSLFEKPSLLRASLRKFLAFCDKLIPA